MSWLLPQETGAFPYSTAAEMRAMGLLPGQTWRRGEPGMQPCRRRSESSQVAPHPPLCRQGPARRQDWLGELHLHNAADFWELPEGNLRALPVLQRILEQSGNTETQRPSRERWNGQTQIKRRSMIWNHYQTESLNSPGESTKRGRSRITQVLSFGWHENQETSAIRILFLSIT